MDSLLRPGSVAVAGASQRTGSFGRIVLDGLVAGRYGGTILPVNPGSLRGYPRLRETRGRPPVDLPILGETIAAFNRVCETFRGSVQAIDVNPLIAGPDGAVAVDATVVLLGELDYLSLGEG